MAEQKNLNGQGEVESPNQEGNVDHNLTDESINDNDVIQSVSSSPCYGFEQNETNNSEDDKFQFIVKMFGQLNSKLETVANKQNIISDQLDSILAISSKLNDKNVDKVDGLKNDKLSKDKNFNYEEHINILNPKESNSNDINAINKVEEGIYDDNIFGLIGEEYLIEEENERLKNAKVSDSDKFRLGRGKNDFIKEVINNYEANNCEVIKSKWHYDVENDTEEIKIMEVEENDKLKLNTKKFNLKFDLNLVLKTATISDNNTCTSQVNIPMEKDVLISDELNINKNNYVNIGSFNDKDYKLNIIESNQNIVNSIEHKLKNEKMSINMDMIDYEKDNLNLQNNSSFNRTDYDNSHVKVTKTDKINVNKKVDIYLFYHNEQVDNEYFIIVKNKNETSLDEYSIIVWEVELNKGQRRIISKYRNNVGNSVFKILIMIKEILGWIP